jgi:predicted HNH restriction endonuclease
MEDRYGPAACELIHVHHLSPISEFGGTHLIDPVKELAPLCPNCHAVAHRRVPPFGIEELKALLNSKKA